MSSFDPQSHRYDFVYLYDVLDGNPNGDPDAGNQPRTDPETGHGIVTDVCLKRKVRNHVLVTKECAKGFDIYVKEKAVLTRTQSETYKSLGLDPKKDYKDDGDSIRKGRAAMCDGYYDVRTFGAVMALKEANCGQVRGAVQMTFGRSFEPILTLEHSITRMAVATEKEAEAQSGDNRTMGRKHTVPYALYRTHGFVTPAFARDTKFTGEDLDLFFEALDQMFEMDRSAARGLMAARGLYIFEHESPLGNAHAHQLFDQIKVSVSDTSKGPVRDFGRYAVEHPAAGPLKDFPHVTLHVR